MHRLAPGLVWLKVALGLAALALLLPAGGTGGSASSASGDFPSGAQNTVVVVENSGSSTTTAEARYLNDDGSEAPGSGSGGRVLGPGYATSFFLAADPDLPSGFRGSATVFSGEPVSTLNIRNINDGGNLSLGTSEGSSVRYKVLTFPMVYKRFGAGWNSRLFVQNLSETTACVGVTYAHAGGTITTDKPAPSSQCPQGGSPLTPLSTRTIEPNGMPVPDSFVGAVRVDTFVNSSGETALLGGNADVWGPGRKFASYSAAGIVEPGVRGANDGVGNAIYVPEVMRQFGSGSSWYTVFHIYNVSPEAPANVTIRYRGTGLPENGVAETRKVTSVTDIYHWANETLPVGFRGSAVISSDREIAVVVARGRVGHDVYAAYLGYPGQSVSKKWDLPLMYRQYSRRANDGWNSWIRVQVADGGPALVKVILRSQKSDPYNCPFSATSRTYIVVGQDTFHLKLGDGWPDGSAPRCFVGSAVVISDRPTSVIGTIVAPKSYAGDLEATFNASK